MNFPTIEIQCEELTTQSKGQPPKHCKKTATHMVVMQHAGTTCETKTFALCKKHIKPAADELNANLIMHGFLLAIGADIKCPDCGQEVTEPHHVGNVEEI